MMQRTSAIRTSTTALLLIASAIAHASPATRQSPISADAPMPARNEMEARVDALAAQYLEKPGAVGLSIAIARGGRVVLAKGYGVADAEFDVKADADTLFRIGSVTKQFTAALVMRYVEQGKLSLDDDVSKYVPEFPLQGKRVTIRQLLNHTSGIPSYTDVGEEWQKKWPLDLSHEELLALVKDKPFDFEPGTKWAYNNTGYYLLGMVLEKVGGKSYGALITGEIAKPLGLTRTRRDSNVELIKNRAQGYAFERTPLGSKLVNDQVFGAGQPGAAGMLLSTARDLVTWQMALTSGKVVSSESYTAMRTPTILPDGKDTGYGFGLVVDDLDGHERVQHGGGIFGFNSMLAWYPKDDLHVAVISNGEPLRSDSVADDLVWIGLGIERPAVKDEPIPSARLTQLVGTYDLEGLGFESDVTTEGGKLFLQAKAPGQKKFRLQWQGGEEYRADFDRNVKIVFSADGRSFQLFQSGGVFQARRKP